MTDTVKESIMKIISNKVLVPLCAAAVLGMSVVNTRAAEPTTKAGDAPEPRHGLKIVHRTEDKVDKLATLLKKHATKVADKTEEVGGKVVTHVKDFGHKTADVVKRTSDKVGKKIDNLSE